MHGQTDAHFHVDERSAEGLGHGVAAARASGALIHGAAEIHEEGCRDRPDAGNALLFAKSKQALKGAAIAVGIAAGGANTRPEFAEDKGLAVGRARDLGESMSPTKHGRLVVWPGSSERSSKKHDGFFLLGEVF